MRRILQDHPQDSRYVRSAVDAWLTRYSHLETVAVYSPLPGEVDLMPLLSCHTDRIWVFPRITGNDLIFHEVGNPASELIEGAYGVREPRLDLPEVPITDIDVFFCPGLAFDTQGGRLGRGKGYYDRTLAQARPDALKIGVCFSCQIVLHTFPAETHDVQMNEVIS